MLESENKEQGGLGALVALAHELGLRLRDQGQRIVTAESCTGGLVAWALTETAGSSDWFERGFVTYSNVAKQSELGVPGAVLVEHGAVSEPVARAMAQGALRESRAQLALAITGIAGPGGAQPGKPVGTVCFGWALGERVESRTVRFDGDRSAVRRQSAWFAIEQALGLLPPVGGATATA